MLVRLQGQLLARQVRPDPEGDPGRRAISGSLLLAEEQWPQAAEEAASRVHAVESHLGDPCGVAPRLVDLGGRDGHVPGQLADDVEVGLRRLIAQARRRLGKADEDQVGPLLLALRPLVDGLGDGSLERGRLEQLLGRRPVRPLRDLGLLQYGQATGELVVLLLQLGNLQFQVRSGILNCGFNGLCQCGG